MYKCNSSSGMPGRLVADVDVRRDCSGGGKSEATELAFRYYFPMLSEAKVATRTFFKPTPLIAVGQEVPPGFSTHRPTINSRRNRIQIVARLYDEVQSDCKLSRRLRPEKPYFPRSSPRIPLLTCLPSCSKLIAKRHVFKRGGVDLTTSLRI